MPAEVKASLASLIFERTRMLNMNYSRGTHSDSLHHPIDTFFSSDTMRDEASPVEDIESFTQRMLALIARRVAQMTSVKKGGHTSAIEAKPPSAVPARAVEGHSSRGSKEKADQTPECEEAASASEKPSTDCLQTMKEVATVCKNDKGESPVVATTMLAVTLEEPTQKRATLYGSSSQEESKSPRLDIKTTVDDLDQLPGVLEGPKHITEEDQLDRSIESVEGVRFDDVHGLTNVSEDVQTKSVPVKKTFEPLSQNDHSENKLAQQNSSLPDPKDNKHSELNLSVGKIQINEDQCVPSSGSRAVGEEATAKTNVHNAACEDISETPQPAIKLCNAHFEELNPPFKEVEFKDISKAVEKPSFPFSSQVTQSNREQMLCINSSDLREQSVAHVKHKSIPDEELIEKSVSSTTVTFEEAHHNSHSSCSESDNGESDDHWIVIPLTISDLRYEPGSEDQERLEKVQLDEDDAPSRRTSDCEVANGGKPHVPQKSSEQNSESEDTCDTEDSCDYPPESKLNYMTVSGHFSRWIPAPLTPAPSVTVTEAEGQQDKNVPNGQTTGLKKMRERLRQLLQLNAATKQKTNGKDISKRTDETFLESDSDDEIDQRRKKKAKRRFPSRSESSEDSSCSQYGKQSPERVDTHKNSMPSVDLQALRSHSTLSDREVMQDAQLSDRTGETDRQIGTKAVSESVQYETKKQGAKKRRVNRSEDTSCTDQVAPLRQSTLHGEELKETIKDPCSDPQAETNADSTPVQHVMNRAKILNDIIIIDSDSEDESDHNLKNNAVIISSDSHDDNGINKKQKTPVFSEGTVVLTDRDQELGTRRCKKVSFRERLVSSSEDSSNETFLATQERLSPEPRDNHHATAPRKVVQATAEKPPLVSRQFSFPPYVGPSTSSRNMSSSNGPPTKARRSSVPPRDLTSSGVSREALNLKSTCTPRPPMTSAKAQPPNSCRSPEKLNQICCPTEGSSYSTTGLTRSRILDNWKRTFPNKGEVRRRRRRPWLDENLGTTCHDSSGEVRPGPSCDTIKEARPGPSRDTIREARPGPSHDTIREARPGPSHSDLSRPVPRSDPLRVSRPESSDHKRRCRRTTTKSLETTAPLMKKTKDYYRQLPKATNREPAKGQSYPVGGNYKWGQPKKGPSREGKQ